MAGAGPEPPMLREVREAVPEEIPVLLNTGARAETIARMLEVADGCIVGSSLKVDGYTWNPVDPIAPALSTPPRADRWGGRPGAVIGSTSGPPA